MKRLKFHRAIVSIAMMLIGWLPSLAHDFEVDGVFYNVISTTEVEVTYKGSSYDDYYEYSGSVVIPSLVEYGGFTYSVTSIGERAFSGCESLTGIEIPNSVKSIGDGAFCYCESLTSVIIGNSVTSIGEGAFYDCVSLIGIEIPNSVTSIGDYAFSDCESLTGIEIPNSVTSIGKSAFQYCESLTGIEIPNSVTNIGDNTFCYCESLTSVVWNVKKCSDFSSYSRPFKNSPITSFTFGDEVEHIPAYLCFYLSSLTSIEIPNSVTSIGWDAFSGCSRLTKITCHATTPPTIEPDTFSNWSADLYVPVGCKAAYEVADYWENFNVKEMSHEVGAMFSANGLNYVITVKEHEVAVDKWTTNYYSGDIVIPQSVEYGDVAYSVTSIGNYAFEDCSSLTSIVIPNSVTSIGDEAFEDCTSLTSVVWNVKKCSDFSSYSRPFKNSPITSFTFGDEVEHIPAYLCFYLSSLTSIEIPNSVTSIGWDAFSGCSSLTSIVVDGGNTIYDSRNGCNAIIETASNTLIAGCQNTIIPNSVTSIEEGAFYYCTSLTSIEIPNSVTSIGDWAFGFCSSLTSIQIPNSVTSIGDDAFYWCESLTSIEIPNSVTWIGDEAFEDCTSLTSVVIGNSVTSIGEGAFCGCSRLTSIEIPNSVTSIGDEAFEDCTSLTRITCHATTPPAIYSNTFSNYDADLYVPAGCISAYQSVIYWKNFNNIIEVTLDNPITLNDNNVTVASIGDYIVVKNAKVGSVVHVYTADGAMIATGVATEGDVIIEAPAKGIYIVTVGKQTVKVII